MGRKQTFPHYSAKPFGSHVLESALVNSLQVRRRTKRPFADRLRHQGRIHCATNVHVRTTTDGVGRPFTSTLQRCFASYASISDKR